MDPLERARETALATVRWAAELPFSELSHRPELVALRDPDAYPIDRGRIVSDRGLDIEPSEFDGHTLEEHVEHSNALHARMRERGSYLTGPLARYNLSSDRLRPLPREAAHDAGLGDTCHNRSSGVLAHDGEGAGLLELREGVDAAVLIDCGPRRGADAETRLDHASEEQPWITGSSEEVAPRDVPVLT